MPANTIRPATQEDAALLAELGARTFRETFEQHSSGPDLEAFLAATYDPAIQRAELADPARPARILEVDGVPVGFLQLRLGHREPGVPGERPVELQRIYLLRTAQGGGRGAALMAEAVEMARAWGADVLWLGVWEKNENAIAFYKRMGFSQMGTHEFFMGSERQTDLIMKKEIESR